MLGGVLWKKRNEITIKKIISTFMTLHKTGASNLQTSLFLWQQDQAVKRRSMPIIRNFFWQPLVYDIISIWWTYWTPLLSQISVMRVYCSIPEAEIIALVPKGFDLFIFFYLWWSSVAVNNGLVLGSCTTTKESIHNKGIYFTSSVKHLL